jgi:YVTN family beta-propeller protein
MHYPTVYLLGLFLATTLAFASPSPEQSVAPPGRVFELLALNRALPTAARPQYRSPCDIKASPDGKYLYVVEQTAKKLAMIDFPTKTLVKEISLPNEGTGAAVAQDGKLVYVTCSSDLWPSGMVCEVSPERGSVLRRLPAGHGARSPVLSHDGKTLYVCNWLGGNVSVVDVASGSVTATMNALREPYAAALTPDDSVLVVANSIPTQRSTDTLTTASKMLLFDTHAKSLRDTLPLPTGSHELLGITISPDGKYAFATHLIGMFAIPATRIDGGHIHTNNVAIVDIKNRKILNDASLDLPMSGAGNPWGIACSPDGKMLCVAHAGANFMSVVDLPQLITIADTCDYWPSLISPVGATTTLSHDLTKLSSITDRITIKGKGPRALTIVGNKAVIAGYFDDYLEVFDLAVPGSGTKTALATWIDIGSEVPKTSLRLGERAFFNAYNCLQKWQSCQSCHPFGRPDGLNWTLNAPSGAPKNSKGMVYSWWTPPTKWSGNRATGAEGIRASMSTELFLQPNLDTAADLDTFFMNLKPVSSPYLVKGRLSASALRGREVFCGSKAACVACHPGPLFTDTKKHNSGVLDPWDANTQWDTPSLVECWRSAPYGHIGSKLTVREMLDVQGMGGVSGKLTEGEIDDLVAFVLSL